MLFAALQKFAFHQWLPLRPMHVVQPMTVNTKEANAALEDFLS